MIGEIESPVCALGEWLRAVDEHAPHHVALLERAQRVLGGQEEAGPAARQALADQLERWRYQHLECLRREPSPLGCRLAEVLDLCARQLVGRGHYRPRGARTALENTFCQPIEVHRALECLAPEVPLETVMQRARRLSEENFGSKRAPARRRMALYAPLYLSSHCINYCGYCAFRYPNAIERRWLSVDEAVEQAAILGARGFRHLLLVAGDFPRLTSTQYFVDVIDALRRRGLRVAVEIAPQSTASYAAMVEAGASGVTLYQEVYDEQSYADYHPRGTKTSYDWRLEGLERAAEAGVGRIGLGILLGLGRPRDELAALVRHAVYLHGRHGEASLAFSLPRIHEAPEGFVVRHPVDDETFIRMYCGLRCAMPTAELVLSTRERPELRDRLAAVCITQLSAGSSTVPGGYENGFGEVAHSGQFPVHDTRGADEVAAWCESAGFDVQWE